MTDVAPVPASVANTKPSKSRVFVVEDHAFMRRNLVAAIERECTLAVCGQAEDAPEALVSIESLVPDIVLTDLELKTSSGLDLIKSLHVRRPALPVIATTVFDVRVNETRARAAGAAGFVAKQDGPVALVKAIQDLLNAHGTNAETPTPFSPEV